jgi:hypothetical protein
MKEKRIKFDNKLCNSISFGISSHKPAFLTDSNDQHKLLNDHNSDNSYPEKEKFFVRKAINDLGC